MHPPSCVAGVGPLGSTPCAPSGEGRQPTVSCLGNPSIEPGTPENVPVPERASNTGDRDGVGVELALSARIVDRHGGEIEVDSTEGEGSTVSFTLPAA